jgi:hypothetical protein
MGRGLSSQGQPGNDNDACFSRSHRSEGEGCSTPAGLSLKPVVEVLRRPSRLKVISRLGRLDHEAFGSWDLEQLILRACVNLARIIILATKS